MINIEAYTDGACSGNPGIGGWGVVLLAKKNGVVINRREIAGGEINSTNNQMELRAAIEALKALKRKTELTLVTDSSLTSANIVKWKWVKGHSGTRENERADTLATDEVKKIKKV